LWSKAKHKNNSSCLHVCERNCVSKNVLVYALTSVQCICMYANVCVREKECVCVCVREREFVCARVCLCVCERSTHVYKWNVYTYVNTYIYIYIYTDMYTYIYLYTYVNTYIYIYIYWHVYIYLSIQRSQVVYIYTNGVAAISRLLKITGIFCKRAL